MWCDIDPICKFYGIYRAAVVGIVNGHILSMNMRNNISYTYQWSKTTFIIHESLLLTEFTQLKGKGLKP